MSHGEVPIKCRPLTYQELRVVQDMSIGRSGQENQVDDNDNRLEFNVFVGDFMAFVLKRENCAYEGLRPSTTELTDSHNR